MADKDRTVNSKLIKEQKRKGDGYETWMDWTDELWEKKREGGSGCLVYLTRWVRVCFVRATDALISYAAEMPPVTKHQSTRY